MFMDVLGQNGPGGAYHSAAKANVLSWTVLGAKTIMVSWCHQNQALRIGSPIERMADPERVMNYVYSCPTTRGEWVSEWFLSLKEYLVLLSGQRCRKYVILEILSPWELMKTTGTFEFDSTTQEILKKVNTRIFSIPPVNQKLFNILFLFYILVSRSRIGRFHREDSFRKCPIYSK